MHGELPGKQLLLLMPAATSGCIRQLSWQDFQVLRELARSSTTPGMWLMCAQQLTPGLIHLSMIVRHIVMGQHT